MFKSGDDLEDDFQEDETPERSDNEVDEGETASAPKTLKSNTKETSRTLPLGKLNAGKYNPKVVKF